MITVGKQIWLLLALVVIDNALKILMLHTLPPGQPIQECLVCLILRLNPLHLGSHAGELAAIHGMQPLITGAIFSLLLAALLLTAALTSQLTKRAVGLSIVAALICAYCLALVAPSVSELPAPAIAVVARAAGTILWLTIWALATSPLWKVGALLYAAAGLSNSLSLIYPPFRIVDYLWSSPLNRSIGIGVFNFADILWLIAPAILAIALVATAFNRLRIGSVAKSQLSSHQT